MPDEADGSVVEPPRRRDGHHLVGRVRRVVAPPLDGWRGTRRGRCRARARCIHSRKRVAVAADLVPADVEVVVAVVVAVRVRRMGAARRDARRRRRPSPAARRARPRLELVDDLLDGDDRARRREHGLLLHAEDPPELDVPAPVGLLRVDDADVRPVRRHRRELLAGERAGRLGATRVCAGRSPPA